MNLDFKIPMSGKVARRLAYLNSIIPLDLDERIMNHIHRDLLDTNVLKSAIANTSLKQDLNAQQLELVQFVADTDYRAILGGLNEEEVCNIVLTAALASGRDLVIISDPDSIMWEDVLPRYNIAYETVVDPLQPITAKVIIVKDDASLMTIKQHARDRVLVYIPHHYDYDLWNVRDDPAVKRHLAKHRVMYTLENLAKEFPFCVMGFYMDASTPVNRIKYWATQKRVAAMIEAINCDKRVGKALEYGPAQQLALKQAGFANALPSHISKILNVNVDMLTDRNFFFETEDEKG